MGSQSFGPFRRIKTKTMLSTISCTCVYTVHGEDHVDERESPALPEGIAAVDELVGPALETALELHLTVHCPTLSHITCR